MPIPRRQRRSIRLPQYDYSQPGMYFVTICTHERRCLFDDPALRRFAEQQWRALAHAGARGATPNRVALDAWVVMPNHVHGMIVITANVNAVMPRSNGGDGDDGDGGAQQRPLSSRSSRVLRAAAAPLRDNDDNDDRAAGSGLGISVAAGSLGVIVCSCKAAVTRRCNRFWHTPGAVVWQRGYWEKIVTNDRHAGAVRQYIASNPARWTNDPENFAALLARMEYKEE